MAGKKKAAAPKADASTTALIEVLAPFAKHGPCMNRTQSRPAHVGKWQYGFFIDVAGHIDEPAVRAALDELKPYTSEVNVLGSYPAAVL